MKNRIIQLTFATFLIAELFVFLPTYAQTFPKSEQHDSLDAVTKSELLLALELAYKYLTEPTTRVDLIYIPEPQRLRMMADAIEQKERDLAYIKAIQTRLALYGIIYEGKKHK